MVLEVFYFHSFTCSYPIFPDAFMEEAVFAPLYVLSSFAKNKLPIGAWVYFWAFYLVPLVYISIFVPETYHLDDFSFVVKSESRRLISPAPFFFPKTSLAILGLLWFHMNCEILYSSSVKNTIGNLTGITLNL